MKYLIVGLGNIGPAYHNTRHNIGFTILDAFAEASNVFFEDGRYGTTCTVKLKGRTLILLKPSTFMNLSGMAVRYWMNKEKIELENLLILVDDIALPFGTLRLKPRGSDAGHNGLRNIQDVLGHNNYNRLRFGVGDNFSRGGQVDYVLGRWTDEESLSLPARVDKAVEIVKSFCLAGLQTTMNQYNNK
ncbi:aminoacyl-tRNA hydrolase [Paludibacter sp. 221]|uniref:aminoacyl-tRNA hydrolase n=1 Tax=Paludibacter sp. 221 TaxID=2302939 RepID=UPI0013D89B9E|nr:aminoacyl-tRNA hydrolase [Paludibacter sp. 221]NDV45762.1 aminoacyl-tRNA hydrolase [Paludibacter sp. 221]